MIVESFPCQSINGHYQSVADIAQRSRLKNDNSKSPQLVQCTRQTTLLWMAKGDGKKKRKKQSPSSASPESSNSDPVPLNPSPMRVSTDINIPIRRQIRYGKINKQLREAQSGTSFRQQAKKKTVRTKYRKTWHQEEIEKKAEERRRKGQDPDWDVILSRSSSLGPLVIVDGYNIIHKWPRLKKHMVKGDLARARQLLVDDLENLRSIKGWRIEVVFDGAGRRLGGGGSSPIAETSARGNAKRITTADKAPTKEVSKHGVRTVFTGSGIEADSYIEARCAEAKNITSGEMTGTFIVATVSTRKIVELEISESNHANLLKMGHISPSLFAAHGTYFNCILLTG